MLQVRMYLHHVKLLLFISTSFVIVTLPTVTVCSQLLQDSPQETRCLECIRSVTSAGVDLSPRRCDSYHCGAYQINYQYWAEAGKPGNSQGVREFDKCARDKNCAEHAVRAYFKKFKRDCNNDGLIDCLDMAALHKGGPQSCASEWFYKSRFWTSFNRTVCVTNRYLSPQDEKTRLSQEEQQQISSQQQPVVMKNQTLTSECLDCICEATSGCNVNSANNCGSGTVCGPFAISQAYWKDGRRPGASWTACARTKECSSVTMKNYMDKHKRDCNGDGLITCEDYAAIHRRGPRMCINRDLLKESYWNKFLACRANQRPPKDVNMVKVNELVDSDQLTTAQTGTSLASRIDSNTAASVATTTAIRTTSTTSTLSPSTITTTSSPTTVAIQTIATTIQQAQRPTMQQINQNGPLKSNSHLQPTSDADLSPLDRETSSTMTLSEQSDSGVPKLSPNFEHSISTAESSQPTTAHYQTVRPLLHSYDYSHSNHQQAMPPQAADSGVGQSKRQQQQTEYEQTGLQASTAAASYELPQQTTMSRRHPSSSVHDYNQLPTLIVSKPLGPFLPSRTSVLPTLQTIASPTMVTYVTTTQTTPPPQTTSRSQYSTRVEVEQQTTSYSHKSAPAQSPYPPTSTQSAVSQSDVEPATQIDPQNSDEQSQASGATHQTALSQGQLSGAAESPQAEPSSPHQIGTGSEEPVLDFSDFPLLTPGNGVDRGNFDKVVNGIVANPDFSKHQPPVPDLVIQGKQQSIEASNDERNIAQQQLHRVTSSTNPRNQPQPQNKAGLASRHTASSSGPYNNLPAAPVPVAPIAADSDPLWSGADSVNLTSLFEKGLNASSRIAADCLECICDASSNCDTTVQCISKQREKNRCGLYMISWNQFQESDVSLVNPTTASGSDEDDEKFYHECATDRTCAEKLIHLYIEKYQKDCNNDGKIDCYDIAAIHRVGPDNCNSGKFLASQYWKDFKICYAAERATTIPSQDASPQ